MELLRTLVESFAPTAFEKNVSSIIEQRLKSLLSSDMSITRDPLGNVTVGYERNKSVMILVSLDQCSFVVVGHDEKSRIYYSPMGPLPLVTLSGSTVCFTNGSTGIINDDQISITIDNNATLPQPGDRGILTGPFSIERDSITAPALEGRIASWTLLSLLEKKNMLSLLRKSYFCFSTHGIVGGRGCHVLAQTLVPRIAIGLHIEPVIDSSIQVGKGPVLRCRDNAVISSSHLSKELRDIAEDHSIPLQISAISPDTAPIAGIHTSGTDCAVLSLAIPLEKAYTSKAKCSLKDCNNAAKLLQKMIETL